MIDAARPTWWHAHEGPPYRCHGGARDREFAEDLTMTCADVEGVTTRAVESLDSPERCPYRVPGWVVLYGRIDE